MPVGAGRRASSRLEAPNDRPCAASIPPMWSMSMLPTAKAERPITHLAGFRGVLQLDGEAATGAARTLRVSPGSVLVACVATFLRAVRSTPAPIAGRALQRIAGLYPRRSRDPWP